MNEYMNNPRYAHLLPYLDPELSKPEQIALLAVCAGLDHPRLWARLPGHANTKRSAAVFASLLDKGLIVQDEDGRLSACSPERLRPTTRVERERVLRRTNVQRTLEFLASDMAPLVALGYSGLAQILDPAERARLTEIALDLERTAALDRLRNQRMKLGRLAKGVRLVPASYLDVTDGSPAPAPSDVLALLHEFLLEGIEAPAERAQHADAVTELYREVWRRGEGPLAHLWRIVDDAAERGFDPAPRWEHVCRRMAAYLMPRGLPDSLLRYREDPKQLQRECPVPEYGYGWWVDLEMELWSQFWSRYVRALGPGWTRHLWVETHERTWQELQREYPDLERLTERLEKDRYRPLFWRVARELSGLSGQVLSALPRRTDAVEEAREQADREWEAYQERKLKRKIEGRSVPLNPQAAEAVRIWIDVMRHEGPVTSKTVLFRSRKGENQPISRVSAYKVLRQVFEDNELTGRLGTHSMRKTFANVVHEKLGRDISKTKKALGHKNINSTDSYLSFLQEEIGQAILAA